MSALYDSVGLPIYDSDGLLIYDSDGGAALGTYQFLLNSDAAGELNKFLLASDSAAGISIATTVQQAQQQNGATIVASPMPAITSVQAQQASVNLISWAYVTLVAPINTQPGSIAYNGQFTGSPPAAGDIIAYDPTLITVNTDGTFSSTAYGIAQASYNDGTGWYPFTIIIAPWDVNPIQAQQVTAAMAVTAKPAITSQQGQQASINIAPLSGITITSIQAQQAAMAMVAAAQIGVAVQENQQVAMAAGAQVNPAISPIQAQQVVMAASTAAQIGFTAQQGQQSNTGVTVPSPIPIAITVQQGQQSSGTINTQPMVAVLTAQSQSASMNVVVPSPVVIAMNAQQGQQSSMAPAAAQTISTASQQSQQNVIQISAAMSARFTAQQAQQASIVLPTAGSPVIAATAGQQSQSFTADILLFPVIGMFAQQAQKANFGINPLPAQLQDLDPEGISFQFGGYLPQQQDNMKVIYIGRDNSATIGVLYYGLPLDLGAITQIQVELIGSGGSVIDSNSSPQYMSWTPGSNVITFRLGNVPNIKPGVYPIALVIYDYAHPDGQTIAGPGLPLVLFDFEQDRVA